MEVASLLRRKLISLPANASIRDAVKLMAEHNVGLLPIVDSDGRPLAVLSERDVIKALASGASLDTPALQIAQRELVAVTPDTDVYDAVIKMRQRKIRHLLVVNKEGKLAGVLSIRDFMRDEVLSYLGFQAWQPPDYDKPEFMSL